MSDTLRMNQFLEAAANAGLDSAILQFGDAVSAREAQAIRTLSAADLKTLSDLHKKIISASTPAGPGGAAPWTCGAVC
jgi:hypothetical protein